MREQSSRPLQDDAKLRPLMDSGIVGIVLWDAAGRIRDANDRFLDIIGYERKDLESGALDWRRLTPAEWHHTDAGAIGEIAANGSAGPVEKEYVRRDGSRASVLLRSTAFDDDPGRVLSIVADIGERKRAELEREALLERERQAREEAQAAVQARDEILAIVSHDLRNPLQTLALAIAALEALAGEKAAATGARARRAIAGMERLIRDLLEVNQIASGRFKVEAVAVEAAALVEDARALGTPLCEAKGQSLQVHHDGGSARVLADRIRIDQAFSNLIGNAVKFTPEGAEIHVGMTPQDHEVVFEVRDSGPGIGAEDLPHIFDRFWQARRVRRGGGVGLGLAITQGIVNAHGGRIWVESRPGFGSRFCFTLPVAG